MAKTSIEWATHVWNPITGCTKVSQGCKHCYAERLATRFWGERKFTDVMLHPERLDDPLKWRKPRRVFVNSMSDLFHKDVPAWFVTQIFDVMKVCKQHTFIILTKRPERIQPVLYGEEGRWYLGGGDYLPNVILGTSCEDQPNADRRIPELLKSGWPGLTVVSCEPLLGPIDLRKAYGSEGPRQTYIEQIDWVIVGGESGPGERPMHPDWARSLRDQCQTASIPFFFKQWGEWVLTTEREEIIDDHKNVVIAMNVPAAIGYNKVWFRRIGKKAAGRILDGREWSEFPGDKR